MNFEYNNFTIPGAKFKISPSSLGKFFEYPSLWFKENILGEKEFIASTATVLGTVCHALGESYALKEKTSKEECDAYIDKMAREVPDIDADEIKALYPDMASLLINDYIRHNPPTEVEEAIYTEIKDGIYVGGSCDNLTGSIIVDYKTAGKKPNVETIPFNYLIQLLAYAYIYKAQGKHIDRVRLVYMVRPTKTLPCRLFTVTKVITDDDWRLISDTLKLVADTVLLHYSNPELSYITFKSYALKEQQ